MYVVSLVSVSDTEQYRESVAGYSTFVLFVNGKNMRIIYRDTWATPLVSDEQVKGSVLVF